MDADEWDTRYAGSELIWGAPPNNIVVEHVSSLLPGRALDLGCGEGRNTLWLANRGWQVDAVDFSQVGIDKGRTVASRLPRSVRDRIEWRRADVTASSPVCAGHSLDLALVIFLHLPAAQRRDLLRTVAAALAPGGTLLVVGHDTTNLTDGYGGPTDPDVLFRPADIVDDLGGLLDIQLAETRHRATDARDALDAVVVAIAPAQRR